MLCLEAGKHQVSSTISTDRKETKASRVVRFIPSRADSRVASGG